MRGTTELAPRFCDVIIISTHVPHAGHDGDEHRTKGLEFISTHVPHAGHDPCAVL